MPEASARRRGTGSPEPTPEHAACPHRLRDGGFLKHERSEGLPGSGYFFGAKAGGSGSPRFSTAARVVISTHSSPSRSFTM